MKKIYCLLLVPAFMLPSCGAKKISNEEALEILGAVHEKYGTLQDTVEAFETTITISLDSYEVEIGKAVRTELKYHIWSNKDSATKAEVKGTLSGDKIDYYIVHIPSPKYEEVTYAKAYNPETKTKDEFVYVKADNNYYSDQIKTYTSVVGVAYSMIDSMIDPYNMEEVLVYDPERAKNVDYDVDINYYSTGSKNLTIKSKYKYSSTMNGNEQRDIEVDYEITYKDLIFASAKGVQKTNFGSDGKISVNFSTKNKPFKIVVPENYEKLIVTQN